MNTNSSGLECQQKNSNLFAFFERVVGSTRFELVSRMCETGLQPAAIDRSANFPIRLLSKIFCLIYTSFRDDLFSKLYQ